MSDAAQSASDEELLDRFRRGEASAFDAIVARYSGPVAHFIYRFVGDREASQDLAQDVFVRIYHRHSTFEKKAKFSSWMFRIAQNLAHDWLKRKKIERRYREHAEEEVRLQGEGRDDADPGVGEAVHRALQRVPPKFRTVLLLCDLQGFTYEEVAQVLGCPLKTVSTRLFRARRRLHSILTSMKERAG